MKIINLGFNMNKIIFSVVLIFVSMNAHSETRMVDKLFEVLKMEQTMTQGFEAMLPMIDQTAARLNLNDEGKAELKEVFRLWYTEDMNHQAILEEFKLLYVDRFSDSEIESIINFYQTPVGQKFVDESGKLMKTGAEIGMLEAQLKQPELMIRMRPLIEKYQIR